MADGTVLLAVADDTETRPLTITTDDGVALEAEVRLPAAGAGGDDAVTGSVVLAHPHPAQGGSMASLVTSRAVPHSCPQRGLAALRFNFRGVGNSGGEPRPRARRGAPTSPPRLEAMADLVAPTGRWCCAGWSFGADVSLSLHRPPHRRLGGDRSPRCGSSRSTSCPLRPGPTPVRSCSIVPEHDQFRPPDAARAGHRGLDEHHGRGRSTAPTTSWSAAPTKAARLVAAFAASLA